MDLLWLPDIFVLCLYQILCLVRPLVSAFCPYSAISKTLLRNKIAASPASRSSKWPPIITADEDYKMRLKGRQKKQANKNKQSNFPMLQKSMISPFICAFFPTSGNRKVFLFKPLPPSTCRNNRPLFVESAISAKIAPPTVNAGHLAS